MVATEPSPRVAAELGPLVRVDHGTARPATTHRHDYRVEHKLAVNRGLRCPADNLAREQVHDHGQVEPALPSPNIGDIGDPHGVGPTDCELSLQQFSTLADKIDSPGCGATAGLKAGITWDARLVMRNGMVDDRRMSKPRFLTSTAPAELSAAVRELWIFEDEGRLSAGVPKPYVEIVVSLSGTHWWRASRGGSEYRYVDAWVTPVQDGPRYARSTGRRHLIGARLEPWAAVSLFGLLPRGDGTPPPRLETLIGSSGRRLRAALRGAADDGERFSCLAQWLMSQPALRGAARFGLAPSDCGANAALLAGVFDRSPRTLRRRFAMYAGISPKQWLTLRRLDAVLRDEALSNPETTLSDLAQSHGYADHAHFGRELKRLTGTTPSALRRRASGLPPHLTPQE
jgi:AraC-like DNA-binding protein